VQPVAVRILHPEPGPGAGELTRLLARARQVAALDLLARFPRAGADDVRMDAGPPDGRPFGARLRALAAEVGEPAGIVVLGSGSIPLAADDDLARLVATAASGRRAALTNNRYSSDVIAVGAATVLASVPDLASDNGLPRWLMGQGVEVAELADRGTLGIDLDSPLDIELIRRHPACPKPLLALWSRFGHLLERSAETLDALAEMARDPGRELLVAGRLSAATLRELEVGTACRIRAFVEERGLRTAVIGQRNPASGLGLLLDRDGPNEIGMLVGRLADGALIDTRVLLAHRLGADEARWPDSEDRYASDLLLPDRVRDPWLQQLTLHTWSHQLPIALGGHTLVGPGVKLALGIG
jgi:CTP:molybdopterin cytidylyltransferase MocA